MNNIPIDELEQKIAAGEEVIDEYFDPSTTRIGTSYQAISRRQKSEITTTMELPSPMVKELDTMASELNISRQAVIKMMLRRALDEHYLAKNILTNG